MLDHLLAGTSCATAMSVTQRLIEHLRLARLVKQHVVDWLPVLLLNHALLLRLMLMLSLVVGWLRHRRW